VDSYDVLYNRCGITVWKSISGRAKTNEDGARRLLVEIKKFHRGQESTEDRSPLRTGLLVKRRVDIRVSQHERMDVLEVLVQCIKSCSALFEGDSPSRRYHCKT
jgi:hypothetical protein